jgi:hypothetical protein
MNRTRLQGHQAHPSGARALPIVGGIYGSKAGVYGVASIYEGLDEKQKEETTAFIYRHYGVAYP